MKDPRIAKLIKALSRRFPGTTIITGPMADEPDSGETMITVLNAPMDPPRLVWDFALQVSKKLWGDDWITAFVSAVSPEQTAKCYPHLLAKHRVARPRRSARRRRRTPAAATR